MGVDYTEGRNRGLTLLDRRGRQAVKQRIESWPVCDKTFSTVANLSNAVGQQPRIILPNNRCFRTVGRYRFALVAFVSEVSPRLLVGPVTSWTMGGRVEEDVEEKQEGRGRGRGGEQYT